MINKNRTFCSLLLSLRCQASVLLYAVYRLFCIFSYKYRNIEYVRSVFRLYFIFPIQSSNYNQTKWMHLDISPFQCIAIFIYFFRWKFRNILFQQRKYSIAIFVVFSKNWNIFGNVDFQTISYENFKINKTCTDNWFDTEFIKYKFPCIDIIQNSSYISCKLNDKIAKYNFRNNCKRLLGFLARKVFDAIEQMLRAKWFAMNEIKI